MPEIAGLGAAAILYPVVEAHEARTGHAVDVDEHRTEAPAMAMAERICVFRFVQEGLNNVSRHLGAAELAVSFDTSAKR